MVRTTRSHNRQSVQHRIGEQAIIRRYNKRRCKRRQQDRKDIIHSLAQPEHIQKTRSGSGVRITHVFVLFFQLQKTGKQHDIFRKVVFIVLFRRKQKFFIKLQQKFIERKLQQGKFDIQEHRLQQKQFLIIRQLKLQQKQLFIRRFKLQQRKFFIKLQKITQYKTIIS